MGIVPSTVGPDGVSPPVISYFGPSIKDWLNDSYPKAFLNAVNRLQKSNDKDFLLEGRAKDKDRNVRRVIQRLESIYVRQQDWGGNAPQYEKDLADIFMPLMCYNALIQEIYNAAYSEYHYRYEKEW